MKIITIIQSNYIPWKGYFDIIKTSDHVIFLDDVQYTRRDWRNRNLIKTPQGQKWLSIPVRVKGKYANLRICEVQVSDQTWAEKHFQLISQNYRKAPYFNEIEAWLRPLYEKAYEQEFLSQINFLFLKNICNYLNIKTMFSWSTDYFSFDELDCLSSTERLLRLCEKEKATDYISGPAAKDYMDLDVFKNAQIKIHWADYSGYPKYPQLYENFTHFVSIIDILMMLGNEAKNIMKGSRALHSNQ